MTLSSQLSSFEIAYLETASFIRLFGPILSQMVSNSTSATNLQLIFGTKTLHKLKHRALQNEYEQDSVIRAHSDVRRYWRAFHS
jgi:hypothetical protein